MSKKDKEKQSMKTECNRLIKERGKGGQQDSPMVRRVQTDRSVVNQKIGRRKEKKAEVERIRQ
jgi:hypothetical protein